MTRGRVSGSPKKGDVIYEQPLRVYCDYPEIPVATLDVRRMYVMLFESVVVDGVLVEGEQPITLDKNQDVGKITPDEHSAGIVTIEERE